MSAGRVAKRAPRCRHLVGGSPSPKSAANKLGPDELCAGHVYDHQTWGRQMRRQRRAINCLWRCASGQSFGAQIKRNRKRKIELAFPRIDGAPSHCRRRRRLSGAERRPPSKTVRGAAAQVAQLDHFITCRRVCVWFATPLRVASPPWQRANLVGDLLTKNWIISERNVPTRRRLFASQTELAARRTILARNRLNGRVGDY